MHLDEYVYFRTDHHWTARGAYYAYSAFCQAAGLEPVPLNALESGKIENFVGSMYRYTNADVLKNNPDYLEYFLPRREADGEYYDDATMKNGRHLTIVSTKIGADNKYLAFIQGDTPLSKIVTDQKMAKRFWLSRIPTAMRSCPSWWIIMRKSMFLTRAISKRIYHRLSKRMAFRMYCSSIIP